MFGEATYRAEITLLQDFESHESGQIITTSAEVTLNGGFIRELPQNPLNSGLGIILICPDESSAPQRATFTKSGVSGLGTAGGGRLGDPSLAEFFRVWRVAETGWPTGWLVFSKTLQGWPPTSYK